jgi:hypothetical protein
MQELYCKSITYEDWLKKSNTHMELIKWINYQTDYHSAVQVVSTQKVLRHGPVEYRQA